MAIGYACLTVGLRGTDLKSCMLKNASTERLFEITEYNLNALNNILDYNIENNIKLFRISSDLIPFASIPNSSFPWQQLFSDKLKALGEKAKNNSVRLSMHPGQYTVLNSPNEDVVCKAILDLNYHSALLDAMMLSLDSKIILHIGGVYQNKEESARRFISHFARLDESVKKRIVLENDDKSYHIADVLEIASRLNIPVVYDNLHNQINPSDHPKSDAFWINTCKSTWKKYDGVQKIHYSQQDLSKKPGSHASTIRIQEFLNFYNSLDSHDIDIMLEVKDKNLSAVKCINCTTDLKSIKLLEEEWSRYKYSVLEKSPQNYQKIRVLLKDKTGYPSVEFYNLIEETLAADIEKGRTLNAILHVWGYCKKLASEKETASFMKLTQRYEDNDVTLNSVKNFLNRMSVKYEQRYLLDSYYFDL